MMHQLSSNGMSSSIESRAQDERICACRQAASIPATLNIDMQAQEPLHKNANKNAKKIPVSQVEVEVEVEYPSCCNRATNDNGDNGTNGVNNGVNNDAESLGAASLDDSSWDDIAKDLHLFELYHGSSARLLGNSSSAGLRVSMHDNEEQQEGSYGAMTRDKSSRRLRTSNTSASKRCSGSSSRRRSSTTSKTNESFDDFLESKCSSHDKDKSSRRRSSHEKASRRRSSKSRRRSSTSKTATSTVTTISEHPDKTTEDDMPVLVPAPEDLSSTDLVQQDKDTVQQDKDTVQQDKDSLFYQLPGILGKDAKIPEPSFDWNAYFETLPHKMVDQFAPKIIRALRKDEPEALQTLWFRGLLDWNCCNVLGERLAHLACREGSVKVMQYLVKQIKVPLRICDTSGKTLLHELCALSQPAHMEIASMVLADAPELLFVKDDRGLTALDYTPPECHQTWLEFLTRRQTFLQVMLKLKASNRLTAQLYERQQHLLQTIGNKRIS
ncbi:ANK [Seminavis robusta]|uniref:ANK n=1 Tax=Seminavis robusta TaxID=568900 RepID=A0A9N8ERT2_9STRA|nr:ANK [Seminavis robusta]|eukprot:Sro1426_g271670.1 ANK (497) ;mRNA; f:10489-11979